MDGLLIIDKPAGLTSHDTVALVRRITGIRRAGHTGTLDPFATGVLPVLVGRATRLARFLSGAEKEYAATIRLGYSTTTGDLTGDRITSATQPRAPLSWTDTEIEAALSGLRGEISQIPPMYSAKRIAGKRLYELARQGKEIDRPEVRVSVYDFRATAFPEGELLRSNADGTCDLSVRVVCSAGTYVRVLAEEVGRSLGIGAHLADLRRTRAGDFSLSEAISLDELRDEVAAGNRPPSLISPDAALSPLPFVHLSEREARMARQGAALPVSRERDARWHDGAFVRLRGRHTELIGVACFDAAAGLLQPRVIIDGGE